MIELFINNRKADLSFDVEIALSKSFVGDGEEFSYSFTLPPTKTNNEIFSHLNKLNVTNKYLYKYYTKLYSNSNLLFKGQLYIDSCNEYGFDCNLVSSKVSDLTDLFGDEKLKDIRIDDNRYSIQFPKPSDAIILGLNDKDWSQAYHLNKQYVDINTDPTNVINWFKPYSLNGQPLNIRNTYTYNLDKSKQANVIYRVTGNKKGDGSILTIPFAEQQLLPMFNVKGVIKSCFEDKGYSCKGNFFDDFNDFSYLYETFRGTYKDFVERDNQRFIVQFTSKDISTKEFESEEIIYNPLLNSNTDSETAIKYNNVYLWTIGKVTSVESGTPRDVDGTGFMVKEDTDKHIKYVKVLKSGWYKVRMDLEMRTDKDSLISRDSTGNIPIDFGSLNRNMWELQLVNKDSNKLYSNFIGLNSSITNNDINLDEYHPDIQTPKQMNSNTYNSHIQDGLGQSLNYVLQKPLSGNNWNTSSIATKLPLKAGTYNSHPYKGDVTTYYNFDFIKNGGTFNVDDDNFVCGIRFGNYHYSYYDKLNRNTGVEMPNRNKYCTLMNLTNMEPKEYGNNAFWLLDNVYKLPSIYTNIRLEHYKLQNNDDNFESGTYSGETIVNLRNSKGYSKNSKFNIVGITPATEINPEQYSLDNHYEFTLEQLSSDYDEGELNYNMACSSARLRDNVTNKDDNNTAITQVDIVSANNVKNVVWLEEGQEITLMLAAPMLCSSETYDEETKFTPVTASIENVNCSIEYIGTHDDKWKPTTTDNVEKYRKSYLHQYFNDVEKASYIQSIKDIFNLNIDIDPNSKTATIDYFNGYYDTVIDITNNTNFDSITFSDNDKSESISLIFKDNTDLLNGSNGQSIFMTSGNGSKSTKKVEYELPITTPISIYGTYYNIQAPIKCVKETYNKVFPSINKYYYSGTETPTLLFWSKENIFNWNTTWYEESANENFTNVKRSYPIMSTKRNDIDLQNQNVIVSKFHSVDSENVKLTLTAYLDLQMYTNIVNTTLIKLNDSLYKCKTIDNYNVETGECEMTLTPFI